MDAETEIKALMDKKRELITAHAALPEGSEDEIKLRAVISAYEDEIRERLPLIAPRPPVPETRSNDVRPSPARLYIESVRVAKEKKASWLAAKAESRRLLGLYREHLALLHAAKQAKKEVE